MDKVDNTTVTLDDSVAKVGGRIVKINDWIVLHGSFLDRASNEANSFDFRVVAVKSSMVEAGFELV